MSDKVKVTTSKKAFRSSPVRNYRVGSRKLYITAFDSENSYDPNGVAVEGLIEVNLTLSNEITSFLADDNLSYITLTGPTTGTGTIRVTDMPIEALQYLANVEVTNNGTIYGSDVELPHCAFKYEEQVSISGQSGKSIDCTVIFDATISISNFIAKANDGKSIADVTLNLTINPVTYMDLQGVERSVTMFRTNSERHKATYAKFTKGIQFPSWELLHEIETTEPPMEDVL